MHLSITLLYLLFSGSMLMILNLLQTLHICCLQPALQEKYYQIHVVQILRTACAQKEKYIAGTMQRTKPLQW
jgi:hypothetical protein